VRSTSGGHPEPTTRVRTALLTAIDRDALVTTAGR
jgi:hypothetical protein